jgi:hypothetical protein
MRGRLLIAAGLTVRFLEISIALQPDTTKYRHISGVGKSESKMTYNDAA